MSAAVTALTSKHPERPASELRLECLKLAVMFSVRDGVPAGTLADQYAQFVIEGKRP